MCNKSASYRDSMPLQGITQDALSLVKGQEYMDRFLHVNTPIDVWEKLKRVEGIQRFDPELKTRQAKKEMFGLCSVITRAAVYRVDTSKDLVWNGKGVDEKDTHSRPRLVDTVRVGIRCGASVQQAVNMCVDVDEWARPQGLQFLGVKSQDVVRDENGTPSCHKSVVFLKGDTFKEGLENTFGKILAERVEQRDRATDAIFLTSMCCRDGQVPVDWLEIPMPITVNKDPAYDGLLAELGEHDWTILVQMYGLHPMTRWVQVTVIDKEQGVMAKGAIRKAHRGEGQVFTKSWKIGHPKTGVLSPMSMSVMETDYTYNPSARLNLQVFTYNFNEQERGMLMRAVMVPAIQRIGNYEWLEQVPDVKDFVKAGGPIDLLAGRVNLMRQARAMESIKHPEVMGARLKVSPNPKLAPSSCILPWRIAKKLGLEKKTQVSILRDPSLACGNSIQNYSVVGFHEGNTAILSNEPWMSIQGGDFDGDDCAILPSLTFLMRGKEWDKTPMRELSAKKSSNDVTKGVMDKQVRGRMAVKSMGANIGKWDLMARRMAEENKLTREMKMACSRAVCFEVDSMKHELDPVEMPKNTSERKVYDIDRIRNEWYATIPKTSIYYPLVNEALKVRNMNLQPRKFPKREVAQAWKEQVERLGIQKPDVLAVLDWSTKVRDNFAILCNKVRSEMDLESEIKVMVVQIQDLILEMTPKMNKKYPGTTEMDCQILLETAVLLNASIALGARVASRETVRAIWKGQGSSR